MTTLLFLYFGAGLVLFAVALPLLAEKVPPNGLYGLRVRATLQDRAVWFAANRFAARRLIWSAAATSISTVVFYSIPGITVDEYSLACTAVFVIGMLIGLVQSVKYARSLAKRGGKP
jgi:uncharacterized membrane protein